MRAAEDNHREPIGEACQHRLPLRRRQEERHKQKRRAVADDPIGKAGHDAIALRRDTRRGCHRGCRRGRRETAHEIRYLSTEAIRALHRDIRPGGRGITGETKLARVRHARGGGVGGIGGDPALTRENHHPVSQRREGGGVDTTGDDQRQARDTFGTFGAEFGDIAGHLGRHENLVQTQMFQ